MINIYYVLRAILIILSLCRVYTSDKSVDRMSPMRVRDVAKPILFFFSLSFFCCCCWLIINHRRRRTNSVSQRIEAMCLFSNRISYLGDGATVHSSMKWRTVTTFRPLARTWSNWVCTEQSSTPSREWPSRFNILQRSIDLQPHIIDSFWLTATSVVDADFFFLNTREFHTHQQ